MPFCFYFGNSRSVWINQNVNLYNASVLAEFSEACATNEQFRKPRLRASLELYLTNVIVFRLSQKIVPRQ